MEYKNKIYKQGETSMTFQPAKVIRFVLFASFFRKAISYLLNFATNSAVLFLTSLTTNLNS